MDSHSHLFFKCSYANSIWKEFQSRIQVECDDKDWNAIMELFAGMHNSKNIDSIISRLSLAACVYFIWQERNNRLFKNESRKWEELLNAITDIIRLRLVSLKVKNSKAVRKAQEKWEMASNLGQVNTWLSRNVVHKFLLIKRGVDIDFSADC
ncbi:reverse transcriptase zinc-binding domain-containing protein [Artemisia annua]|uniref:Reverse transcriptase zinc-binding domain-containing protein n=1 Tax=Artemisia annua TaxID=35608 RepID=A0A2U1PQV6_ARTAN|nr:reverse transcriptase zinc-binding domain-containing protein [Artemisia annua]